MTFYTAYKTDSGNISEAGFTPEKLRGLTRQITLMLAGNPKFRAQNARQKQTLFEGALMMAMIVGHLNGQAQKTGDAKLRTQAKQSARKAFSFIVGKMPDQVRLSDNGLVF